MTFARTKIQQPRPRPGLLLARPSLERSLAAALGELRAVLLCAPAGCGKTALLTRALALLPARHAVAWIALDPGDEMQRVLECLVAALEPLDPPWRSAPEGLIAAAPAQPGRVADELVNTLQACDVDHGVIVLDDLHHVDDAACLDFLSLLLRRLGERWTLAITAREEPPLKLARLRAAGELLDIGEAALRFSRDEVAALLSGAGADAALADALHERTGGWAAGLRLGLSGARGGGAGSIDRAAFDYLAAEVLTRLEPGLHDFLLRTSVLHELDAPRCAAVSGDDGAARRLEQIERLGLYATLVDEVPPTWKLHELFRDALRHRLRMQRPDEVAPLLRRGAAGARRRRPAAAVESDPVRRQEMLLAAGSPQQAAQALLASGPGLLIDGGVSTVLRLCGQFPAADAHDSAELQMLWGEAEWAVWHTGSAERRFDRAEVLYLARGDGASAQLARARRAVTLVAQGRLREAAALVDDLREAAMQGPARRVTLLAATWHALESASYHAVARHFEALVERLEADALLPAWATSAPPPRQTACRGIAPALARWADGALAICGDRPLPLRTLALLTQGWLGLWQGRVDEAAHCLERADADAQWVGQQVISRSHALALRAVLAAVRGDAGAALQAMRTRLDEHTAGYGNWGLWHSLHFAARVAAACGDATQAGAWVRRLLALQPSLPDADAARLRPTVGLQGTLAWLEGRRDEAVAHWRAALADEEHIDLLGQAHELRLRLAHARAATAPDEAAALLIPVLKGTDGPGGALLAGDALRSLAAADWRQRLPEACADRLRQWARVLATARRPAAVPAQADAPRATGAAALSSREREVLALIARGEANKVIARTLDLSPHTVKRHVAHILDKLGCDTRGQAAAWHAAQGG